MENLGKAYVCRCEEITEEEIIRAIELGDRTVDAIKKRLRVGMGPCQGTGCGYHVAEILSEKTGIPIEQCLMTSARLPVGTVSLHNLAEIVLLEDQNI